jgi:hypothetical protein
MEWAAADSGHAITVFQHSEQLHVVSIFDRVAVVLIAASKGKGFPQSSALCDLDFWLPNEFP